MVQKAHPKKFVSKKTAKKSQSDNFGNLAVTRRAGRSNKTFEHFF